MIRNNKLASTCCRDTVAAVCDHLAAQAANGAAAADGVDMQQAALRVTLDSFALSALQHDFGARHYGRCEVLEVGGWLAAAQRGIAMTVRRIDMQHLLRQKMTSNSRSQVEPSVSLVGFGTRSAAQGRALLTPLATCIHWMAQILPPLLAEFSQRALNPLRAVVHSLMPWQR